MTKKPKKKLPYPVVGPSAPIPVSEPPAPKAATRRGFQTCCQTCARKAWCVKNPTKGRQACNAVRKGPECINLIQSKWCTVCPLHAGQAELEDPDQTKMFVDEKATEEGTT